MCVTVCVTVYMGMYGYVYVRVCKECVYVYACMCCFCLHALCVVLTAMTGSSEESEASRRIKTEFLVQLDGASTSSQAKVWGGEYV